MSFKKETIIEQQIPLQRGQRLTGIHFQYIFESVPPDKITSFERKLRNHMQSHAPYVGFTRGGDDDNELISSDLPQLLIEATDFGYSPDDIESIAYEVYNRRSRHPDEAREYSGAYRKFWESVITP